LGVFIVGFSRLALGADALDNVEALSAIALTSVEVIDLVGSTLDSANHLVNVIELTFRALGAEVIDQVETRLADTPVQDPVFVLGADRSAHTVASLSADFLIPGNAVAALALLVVNLSPGVALTADAVNQVEPWEAAASSDGRVPYLVCLALCAANSIYSIVGLSGRAHSARVSDQVVSFLTDALSILIDLIGVAGGSTETKVLDEASIARAGLSEFIVLRISRADITSSITHLEVLRETDALALTDIVDSIRVTGYSADAKTLIVYFIPVTLSTNAFDGVVTGLAAALSVQKDFIYSTSNSAEATSRLPISGRANARFSLSIISRVALASQAGTVDAEVGGSTVALAGDDVVDFVGFARNAADSKSSIEECVSRALSANTSK
jgi:hypothetical protein